MILGQNGYHCCQLNYLSKIMRQSTIDFLKEKMANLGPKSDPFNLLRIKTEFKIHF